MSFLAIQGLHAFVTGAEGGIGTAIVKELVGQSAGTEASTTAV
jgi:NAD(P)-dependent dehydrogenase (short-subunit alcohol dehydrogenase family)